MSSLWFFSIALDYVIASALFEVRKPNFPMEKKGRKQQVAV